MAVLIHRGEGPSFSYAGQLMHILAGHDAGPPPPEPALAFMRDIGAVLSPDVPPDPHRVRDVYARHASRLLPRGTRLGLPNGEAGARCG